jgi:hypothetical protein
MKTQNFVDQHNASLSPSRVVLGEGGDFQKAYIAKLLNCEQKFDNLTEALPAIREPEGSMDIYSPTVYKAINMGDYILGRNVQMVAAQLSRNLLYKGVKGKNRMGRRIELFIPGDKMLAAIGKISLVDSIGGNQRIGSVTIDSSRTRAIPSSVGILENFSELLDEVIIRAAAEKLQQS